MKAPAASMDSSKDTTSLRRAGSPAHMRSRKSDLFSGGSPETSWKSSSILRHRGSFIQPPVRSTFHLGRCPV
jgi:hypothetical protein